MFITDAFLYYKHTLWCSDGTLQAYPKTMIYSCHSFDYRFACESMQSKTERAPFRYIRINCCFSVYSQFYFFFSFTLSLRLNAKEMVYTKHTQQQILTVLCLHFSWNNHDYILNAYCLSSVLCLYLYHCVQPSILHSKFGLR